MRIQQNRRASVAALAIGISVVCSVSAARAEEPLGTHQTHFRVQAGVRTAFIPDAGYDPFSEDDVLVQVTLGGGRTLFAQDAFSIAAVGLWDYGVRTGKARGAETELHAHRFSLGPEARYHLLPIVYGFVRVMPALLYTQASLKDTAAGVEEYSKEWAFGVDATLGAAAQIYGMANPASNQPRVWGIGEIGYGYATSSDLKFTPDEDDDDAPQRQQPIDLGSLALRGFMFRISAAVTF